MGDHRDWDSVANALSTDFDCITVDLPGHGQSINEGETSNFASVATSIIDIADEVDADSFSLVGYSLGGRLALYFANLFAMRIDTLILESASPGLHTQPERAARCKHDEALACHLESQPLEQFIDAWYAQPLFATMHRHPERFAALRARRLEQNPKELANNLIAMGTGAQPPVWDDLPDHHIPTLLILGEHDEKFRDIADEMAALSSAIQIETIPECGHNVHFENPERYTARLRDFLNEQNQAN
jgi:2-succinyl-6-hydroxy-2,4-cyclohexadiene-1-carboxylate synthase